MAVPPDLDFGSLTTLPVWLRVLGARDLPNSLSRTRSPTRKSVVTTICCFNFFGCSIAAKALIARPSPKHGSTSRSALLCARRPGALELDAAFLCDRRLLNGNHLSLHLRQLGRGLLVAAYEERRRPEDDDSGRCGDAVLSALTILCA